MRRFFFTVLSIAAVAPAFAQSPPAGVPLPDPLHITINRSALQAIGQGLMKLPYETSAPILADLQNQLNAADKAAADAAKPKEPALVQGNSPDKGAGGPNPAPAASPEAPK